MDMYVCPVCLVRLYVCTYISMYIRMSSSSSLPLGRFKCPKAPLCHPSPVKLGIFVKVVSRCLPCRCFTIETSSLSVDALDHPSFKLFVSVSDTSCSAFSLEKALQLTYLNICVSMTTCMRLKKIYEK